MSCWSYQQNWNNKYSYSYLSRVKQEQSDQRKLEEKLRREEIFRQYQEKKHKEDEETRPVVKRERSFRQKSRPQSMFVKPNKPAHKEPLHTSQEDLTGNTGLILM